VASTGLIVIAPDTHGSTLEFEECSSYEYKDMLLALSVARAGGSSLHVGLQRAVWTRTGVWGYSMGAKTTPMAANQSGYNIHAALLMHGARNSDLLQIPSMFTTGTNDNLEGPETIYPQFEEVPSKPKIYLNLEGADHTEPSEGGRLNIWGGRFLACHLSQRSRQCHAIYGKGQGTLCSSNSFADCIVLRKETDLILV